MDRQVVRWTNAPAQVWPHLSLASEKKLRGFSFWELSQLTCCQSTYSKEQLIERLLGKSHECNVLAQENQRLTQENATFRLQLNLTSGARGPVNGTPESGFQADNLQMRRYIMELHGKQEKLNKTIEEQQETIESLRKDLTNLRTKIRHARDFLDSM